MQVRRGGLQQVAGLGRDRVRGEVADVEHGGPGLARFQGDVIRLHREREGQLLAHLGAELNHVADGPIQEHLPALLLAHQLHRFAELDHRQRAGAAAAAQLGGARAQRGSGDIAGGGIAGAVQQAAELGMIRVRRGAMHGNDAAAALQVAVDAADLDEPGQLADQFPELGGQLRVAGQMLLTRAPAAVGGGRQVIHRRRIVGVARAQQPGRNLFGGRRAYRQEGAAAGSQYHSGRRYGEQSIHAAPNNTGFRPRRPSRPSNRQGRQGRFVDGGSGGLVQCRDPGRRQCCCTARGAA